MRLTLVTPAAFEPVSRREAKLHLRVESTDDDALIDTLNLAATQHVKDFTGRALAFETWDYKLDALCGDELWLPKAPTSSVTSISYVDSNGDTQTWSTDEWDSDLPSGPQAQKGRAYPAYSYSWPTVRSIPNAITVRFVAGYGGTSKSVSSITQASGTATATFGAAHGYATGDRITFAGAVQEDYNGTFRVTVSSATVVTFSVASTATTPATGTITAAKLDIPAPLIAAHKLLVGHWYLHRESVIVGNVANVVPQSVDTLLWPFRVF